jgi:hypothetical protein
MDFGSLGGLSGGIGGAINGYLATPEGKAAITKYLGSQEGISFLQNFAGTAEGQKVITAILPTVLSSMNLPPGVADMIKNALGSQQASQQ